MGSPEIAFSSLPAPYFTFNPNLFENTNSWSYRDLQKLCRKLNLVARGSRDELTKRLEEWHRSSITDEDERTVRPQNFSLLGVKVPSTDDGAVVTDNGITKPSNRLLSPLMMRNKIDGKGTPVSILKKSPMARGERNIYSLEVDEDCPNSRLLFSPYNSVQLIPNRLDFD